MSYKLQATIVNNLQGPLIPIDPEPKQTSGTVTTAPVKINAGDRKDVVVAGADATNGAAGEFIYNVKINNNNVEVDLNYLVNDAGANYARISTTRGGNIDVHNTPYSPEDHPLIVTFTLFQTTEA